MPKKRTVSNTRLAKMPSVVRIATSEAASRIAMTIFSTRLRAVKSGLRRRNAQVPPRKPISAVTSDADPVVARQSFAIRLDKFGGQRIECRLRSAGRDGARFVQDGLTLEPELGQLVCRRSAQHRLRHETRSNRAPCRNEKQDGYQDPQRHIPGMIAWQAGKAPVRRSPAGRPRPAREPPTIRQGRARGPAGAGWSATSQVHVSLTVRNRRTCRNWSRPTGHAPSRRPGSTQDRAWQGRHRGPTSWSTVRGIP